MENRKREIRKARNRQNVLIGLIGGVFYALFAWGIDLYWLSASHYAFPWIKLLIGSIPSILLITLAAWFATKLNNVVSKALLWIVLATGLSLLVSFITFQGTEWAYRSILQEVGDRITYSATTGIKSRLFVIVVMTNILFILGGLLIESASEALITASGFIGWLFPVLFCLAFFAGAGFVADSNFNTELRDNILALDQQIEEISKLDIAKLGEREERMVRRFTKLEVNLGGERHLLISNFDETFSQTEVLINFDEVWVQCLALNGFVGNCERLGN